MAIPSSRRIAFAPSLYFALLSVLLGIVWLAGGASRADELGQTVVRAVAWTALIVVIVFADRPATKELHPIMWLLGAAIGLAAMQLVPLPPGWWQTLPGHAVLSEAAAASGQPQPWRPVAMVPGATLNAMFSLIVPVTTLALVTGLTPQEQQRLPNVLMVMIVAMTVIGLLQLSRVGMTNPFANETPGQVSGMFANRNHFALLLAIGCLLAPAWAFPGDRPPGWRVPIVLGLVTLFELMILATGSRAGLLLGVLALVVGTATVWGRIRRKLRGYPGWVLPMVIAAMVAIVVVVALVSIGAGRAASLDRIFTQDVGQDMRSRGLPTVLAMIREYFPFGSGLGGFDPIFRMHEPFALLKPTFFNHAHNDFLEIALAAGLPGITLVAAAIGWWGWASARAWRRRDGTVTLARLGSGTLLLVLIASIFDYPARTPIMMAIIVVAASWLCRAADEDGRALPRPDLHL